MLHTSFKEIGLPVPEKNILRGFTIYGLGSLLCHVTNIIFIELIEAMIG